MTVKRKGLFLIGLIVAALALVASGCGGDSGGDAPEALPSSSCTAIEYEGDGNADYIIASDLPLQGSSRAQSEQINAAIRYELGQREWKAGDYNIGFQACDDATAQAAKWDSGKCSQNANAYAANDKVIGVIGTFNSGCAAIMIPVLNEAADGGIPMVSPANTWPCLTVNLPGGCAAEEPDKFYPSGTRNYLRVAPADDYQGAAVAEFAQGIGVKKVYILNDKEFTASASQRPSARLPSMSGSRSPGSKRGIRRLPATRPCSRRSKAPEPMPCSSVASPTRTADR